jgi:hypothetical protein
MYKSIKREKNSKGLYNWEHGNCLNGNIYY